MEIWFLAIDDRKSCLGIEVRCFASDSLLDAAAEEVGKEYCENYEIEPDSEMLEEYGSMAWLEAAQEAGILYCDRGEVTVETE